jgi:hypothetical protein
MTIPDIIIIESNLSRTVSRDGTLVEIHIYHLEEDTEWTLEVEDEVPTESEAYNEVMRTIDEEGIRTFLKSTVH